MVPTLAAQAWAAKMRPEDMMEFERYTAPQFGQEHLNFRPRLDPPFRLNVLRWPVGSSDWATFHFLCDANDLVKLRQKIYRGGYNSLPLTMESESDFGGAAQLWFGNPPQSEPITTQMFLLPPRHVSEIHGHNDLYLCTLVDDRYFWWFQAANIVVDEGTTTWLDLYLQIASGLGLTSFLPDEIPPAYLMPSADFSAAYQDLPPLFDAVALSCGQRIVRQLDGKVFSLNALTSIALANKQFAWEIEVGGHFAFIPLINPCDLNALVPASLTVTFQRSDFGNLTGQLTPYLVTLESLALPEFRGIGGFRASKVIRTNTIAYWTSGTVPMNDVQLQALAEQIARDWYRWQLGRLDIEFAGIRPWVPEGLHRVEWGWQMADVGTRVRRWPWNDTADLMGIAGMEGSKGPCCCANVIYRRPTGFTTDSILRKLGETKTFTTDSYFAAPASPSATNFFGNGQASGNSLLVTFPATQAGSTMLIGMVLNTVGTITPPAGWVLVDSRAFSVGTYIFNQYIYKNIPLGTNSATWNFSMAGTSCGSGCELTGLTGDVDVQAANATAVTTGPAASNTTAGLASSNEVGVYFGALAGSSNTISSPTNSYAIGCTNAVVNNARVTLAWKYTASTSGQDCSCTISALSPWMANLTVIK